METIAAAFGLVFEPYTLFVILLAAIFGLFVGAVPGLTATMATALLVPVTFFMPPVPAVAAIVTAMRAVALRRSGDFTSAHPWFFPAPAIYQRMLEARGFTVRRIGLFPRPTPLPTGMASWLKLFRKPFFDQFENEAEN